MLQQLLDHFESFLPFDEAEKSLLEVRFVQPTIKRRHTLLQEGFGAEVLD